MASVRIAIDGRDEDSPTSKKPKTDVRFPLSRWELAAAVSVFVIFSVGLFCVFRMMPEAEYDQILKLPKNLADLRILKDNLAVYASDYEAKFMLGYCATYIFMQTFMIPGTIFMSLLAGALFGVVKGVILVVFCATSGASSCYFLSKLIGRPLVNWLWPEKLRFFQAEIAKRKEKLLNYMLFLRITPTLPNTFINLASPIVDIPFHIFFLATMVGLIPASYITVRQEISEFKDTSVAAIESMGTPCTLTYPHSSPTCCGHQHIAIRCVHCIQHIYAMSTEETPRMTFLRLCRPCSWGSKISQRFIRFQDLGSFVHDRFYLYTPNHPKEKADIRIMRH